MWWIIKGLGVELYMAVQKVQRLGPMGWVGNGDELMLAIDCLYFTYTNLVVATPASYEYHMQCFSDGECWGSGVRACVRGA